MGNFKVCINDCISAADSGGFGAGWIDDTGFPDFDCGWNYCIDYQYNKSIKKKERCHSDNRRQRSLLKKIKKADHKL